MQNNPMLNSYIVKSEDITAKYINPNQEKEANANATNHHTSSTDSEDSIK